MNLSEFDQIIICFGGIKAQRICIMDKYIRDAQLHNLQMFTLPSDINSWSGFINASRKIFPISSPLGIDRYLMSEDQIYDMLFDWTEVFERPILIVWPEVKQFAEIEDFFEILNSFLTSKYLKDLHFKNNCNLGLIVSTEIDVSDYLNHSKIFFGRIDEDKFSDRELAEKMVKFFNCGEQLI